MTGIESGKTIFAFYVHFLRNQGPVPQPFTTPWGLGSALTTVWHGILM